MVGGSPTRLERKARSYKPGEMFWGNEGGGRAIYDLLGWEYEGEMLLEHNLDAENNS